MAGSEQVRVRMLKQPHMAASKIERITKFCLSTDPYTFTSSPWRFSRVREEDCAIMADSEALLCGTSLWSLSVVPDLLLIFPSHCLCRVRMHLACLGGVACETSRACAQSKPVHTYTYTYTRLTIHAHLMVCKVGVVTSPHCTSIIDLCALLSPERSASFEGELIRVAH